MSSGRHVSGMAGAWPVHVLLCLPGALLLLTVRFVVASLVLEQGDGGNLTISHTPLTCNTQPQLQMSAAVAPGAFPGGGSQE